MLLKVLEEVARRREKNVPQGSTFTPEIQISSMLMRKAIDEVNGKTSLGLKQDDTMNEFQYSLLGKEWTIRSRAYRDNTTDDDVEEVLYEVACQGVRKPVSELDSITKEKLQSYQHTLTVGGLKEFIEEHNMPDSAIVVVQRVTDVYFEKHGWSVYLKEGEHTYSAKKWNQDIIDGTYLDKEEYPNMKEENLIPYTEKGIIDSMEQYHPAWCVVHYGGKDSDILFIDMHY